MKRNWFAAAMIAILALGGSYVYSATSTPGSEGDPLVTQAYVDQRTTFKAFNVTAGQKLLGGAGTEIILRAGEASAIDNGANGISDVTTGKDLMSGQTVGANHLILVPREDGRGIYAITDITVMVKGIYTIQ